MSKLWGSRFRKKTNPLVDEFSSSISYDKKLAKYDCLASIAHAQMLGKAKIISGKESAKIVQGLKSILNKIDKKKFNFDKNAEDIHTNIQNALEKKIGRLAEKLHTARSRNDLVATDLKMYAKDEIKNITAKIKFLQGALLNLAQSNITVVIPGLTHLQHAQAVCLAHQLLAYVEMLERDKQRLNDAYKRCDVLPLGAGAIAGTNLPINRNYLAKLLGFAQVAANSIDAVSDRDFALEILSNLAILAMHLSRMAEDFILWASAEFSIWELDDAYATGSSLMPQKKNPDVLELVRGHSGTVYGNLVSLLTTMKGLPLAYNRDMQLDKLSLFKAVETMDISLAVLTGLIKTAKINQNQALILASDEFLCATDLAEYLVKKKVSFKQAHQIVGRLIGLALKNGVSLSQIPLKQWQDFCPLFNKDAYKLLDSKRSVLSKKSLGGTNPKNIKSQIVSWKKRLK